MNTATCLSREPQPVSDARAAQISNIDPASNESAQQEMPAARDGIMLASSQSQAIKAFSCGTAFRLHRDFDRDVVVKYWAPDKRSNDRRDQASTGVLRVLYRQCRATKDEFDYGGGHKYLEFKISTFRICLRQEGYLRIRLWTAICCRTKFTNTLNVKRDMSIV